MGFPELSVLLPVFDAIEYLPTCLQSLKRQTYREFEVVAVDDGSGDGSAELLDEWAHSDRRIRVLHRVHEGLVPALNAGLAECRAPLVARMDADDVAHPRRLERQIAYLVENPEIDVVSCLVQSFPRRVVGEGYRIYEAWLNGLVTHGAMAAQLFVESPLAHPSAMFRAHVVSDVGGYRDNDWPEDYDLWLRLFESGQQFAKVPEVLYFWREHESRLTRTNSCYSKDAFLRCKAHHLARGPAAPPAGVVLWGAGVTGRRLARYLIGEGVTIRAVVDIDPSKIGRALRGLPIISPGELPALLKERSSIVVTSVASRGARDLIRKRLQAMGLEEGADFWCAA